MSTYTRTSYWWDFNQPGSDTVVVESDHPEHPIVATFPYAGGAGIDKAAAVILDLKEGRTTLKKVLAKYGHTCHA